MESRQGVFKSGDENKTYTDVKNAIASIDAVLATTLDKSVFRDILTGFKILIKSLQEKKENEEAPICDILLKWLNLYLRTQNALPTNDVKLQEQFEKFVPASFSYIVLALQNTPKGIAQYHYQILELLLKLLDNVTESTLKKVANLETNVITFLWRPIESAGDFNTQMMAFRIVVKLLKCLNNNKQHKILTSLEESNLQEPIYSAIRAYNSPPRKFEKIARSLLNHYNMNLAKNNVLVYSIYCKSASFGDKAAFYKNLHEDKLWIDLNYSPRTVTFESRYRSNNRTKYIDVGVTLHIAKFSLNENILNAVLEAPPQFTKITTQLKELRTLREVRFELPDEEVLRLQENQCVIDHYNSTRSLNQLIEPRINTPSDPSISDEDQLESPTDDMNALCPPKKANSPNSQDNRNKETCDNFQKSYDLLIAQSGNKERNKNNPDTEALNIQFKTPSLPRCEVIFRKTDNVVVNESPKTSRPLDDEIVTVTEKVNHPIAELTCPQNNERRFFKRKADSSDDTNQCTKKYKTKKSTKRIRSKKIVTSPPRRKQVNKVKPMNHLAKNDGDPEEAAQEYVENGGIVNITNFLRNGNESTAVFNEDQRRLILQNVNRISDGLERSAKLFFRKNETSTIGHLENGTINKNVQVYEETDSEAEPGRSYQNFVTSRLKQEKPKRKRTRKNTIVSKTITNNTEKNNNQMALDDDVPSTSRAAVERTLRNNRKRNTESLAAAPSVENATDVPPLKVPKLESKNSKTIFSGDIEIDLTLESDNGIENNLTAKLSDNKRISSAVEENSNAGTFFKRVFQQQQTSHRSSPSSSSVADVNNDDEQINKLSQPPPVDNIVNNIEEFNEIQECRDGNAVDAITINDLDLSPIHIVINKNYSPALSNVMDEEAPQNTNAILLSGNKENGDVPITSNQMELNKNDFFKNTSSKISPIKKGESNKIINFKRPKTLRPSQENFNDCILYRSRSESESSDESDQECTSVELDATFLKQPLKTPTKFTIEHTAKKSITRSSRNSISSALATCKVTTSITHEVISQDAFLVPHVTEFDEGNLNDDVTMEINELRNDSSVRSNFPIVEARTTNCITKYFNDLDKRQHHITKDISQLLWTFQEIFISKFQDVYNESNLEKNSLDIIIKKIIDLSENMLIETEKERLEMEQSEKEINKLLCQLSWQCDVLQAKTKRFNGFNEKMLQFLDTVANINMEEKVNKEFTQNLSTIQEHGSEIRKKQWTEYIDGFTKNLLQNVSKLSTL